MICLNCRHGKGEKCKITGEILRKTEKCHSFEPKIIKVDKDEIHFRPYRINLNTDRRFNKWNF